MSVSNELGVFLVALIGGLITLIPALVAVLRVYLKVLENRARIDDRPTRGQVGNAIDAKISALGLAGGNDDGTASAPISTGTVSTTPGASRRRSQALSRDPGADPPDDDQRA